MTFGSFGLPELLIILIVVVFGLFWIRMLIEAATRETDSSERLIWVLIIVFLQVLGAAIYFFVRRPVRKARLGR